jgi:lipoprotein-anchoring transpeptidase ErfK/SrfK
VLRTGGGGGTGSATLNRLLLVLVALVVLAGALIAAWPQQHKPTKSVAAAATVPHSDARAVTAAPKKPEATKPVGVLVAWARVSPLPVYAAPGARSPAQDLPNPNNLGAPLVMLVNSVKSGWVQAYLPERPNESLGWTPADDVSMTRDPDRIVVCLDCRRLQLFQGKKLLFQAVVAVGSPESPTPTGHFYVTERIKVSDPAESPYGPYALGLSGFSNTYTSFDGGPGQIAIHGTDEPSEIGQYASHGCVRLNNADITTLEAQVEDGTPVDIIE